MGVVLVPEMLCRDVERTRAFYVGVLGFRVKYERHEERFIYLEREGAEVMFEEIDGPPVEIRRQWVTGALERPLGRGVNFQIQARDVVGLWERVSAECERAGGRVWLTLEEKRYMCGDVVCGVRQFVVMDPDGYLLRFAEDWEAGAR